MSSTLRRRRHNSVLAALERVRRLSADATLGDIVAFLYVCENEGVNVRELAQLASMTHSTASRTARRLASRDSPYALWPFLGLAELRASPHDGRSRTLYLTQPGADLRNTLEALIADARPIVLQR
jgi:DNA-binding MarR family transcriptional regulator